jgi:putative Mg2+ transporter-C (MgtC) family protein
MTGISTVQFGLRLVMAIGMGALVGLERQWRQRMAGTRTNALVAGGAAAFIMCGLLLDNDPSARGRIVSYVVSGVGFLGAESSSKKVVMCVGSTLRPQFGAPPPWERFRGLAL